MKTTGKNMRTIKVKRISLLGFAGACVAVMNACAMVAVADDDLFTRRTEHAFDPATIDAVGDKVADWQLANLDDLTYIRNFRDDFYDQRGWIQGALFIGMMNWASLPGNEKYDAALKAIAEQNGWRLGDRLFHGDDHVVGQLYLHFFAQDQDRDTIDHTIRQFNQILVVDPDNSLEFLGDSIPGVGWACQLRWCWCDALFMSPPTWIGLSLATGDDRYMEYGDREFWATTDYLLDPEYKLYYRDSRYFTRQDDEGNKVFWARGNGWVYAGVVNILRILPKDHPSYPRYMKLFKDMSATIADIQHENGLWRVSLLAKEKYASPETSGSSFLTYGLAWGLNNGHLDVETYGPVVRKGWQALVEAVADDGKLGWVQPVGSAPDSVFETDSHLYGVGAFLLAASQMIQAQ
jgi:rhamnogalacturonyl hydrolase YesR